MSSDYRDIDLDNWEDDGGVCPECGSPTLTGTWYDDHPDNGGACIGTKHRCVNDACDYFETR